jgi:hypothetical protein
VLARSVVPPLDRALVLEAAVSLEKEFHPLTPAQPANGVGVTSHLASLSFAPVPPWHVASTPAAARRNLNTSFTAVQLYSCTALRRGGASAAGSRCAGSASRP